MTTWYRSLVAALAVGALGCSSSTPASEPVPEEDWLRAYSEARCEIRFRCCTASEREAWHSRAAPPPATEEECVAQALELGGFFGGSAGDRWDAAAAGRCVTALSSLTCDEYVDVLEDRGADLAACGQMIRPTVEDGGACVGDGQCFSGYCDSLEIGEEGVCGEPPTEGEPCFSACADGLFCDNETDPRTCQREREDGAECRLDEQCVTDCVGRDPLNIHSLGTCGVRTTCAP